MNYRLLTFFVFLIFLSCSKFDSEDELGTNSNTFPFYDNLSEVNNFPKMVISTNNQEIFDEPKINAELKVIEESIELDYKIAIETRGSSSQMFPKKSYGFETRSSDWSEDIDVNLGGFPEEEDWILYGPYSDKSMPAIEVAFGLEDGEISTSYLDLPLKHVSFKSAFIMGHPKKISTLNVDGFYAEMGGAPILFDLNILDSFLYQA